MGQQWNNPGTNWADRFNTTWITGRVDDKAVEFANEFAEQLLAVKKEGISTSQFRNIYGELKRIQLKGLGTERTAFHLLLPKIAYAVKRSETRGSKAFNEVIKKAHRAVDVEKEGSEARFKNFCDIIEALLAYHKFHGGDK